MGAVIIPPGWWAHNQPPMEAFLLDRCDTQRDGAVTTDALGTEQTGLDPVETGMPCLVETVQAGTQVDANGRPLTVAGYLMRFEATRDIRPGDWITVAGLLNPATAGLYRVSWVGAGTTDVLARCTLTRTGEAGL